MNPRHPFLGLGIPASDVPSSRSSRAGLAIAAGATTLALMLTSCAGGASVDGGSATTTSAAATPTIASSDENTSTTTAETLAETAAAAQRLLETLSEEQREQLLHDYDDATRTTSWSNFPVTFVERAGLNLSELTGEQRSAAMGVLAALLSQDAYETVVGIMEGDAYLLENSSSGETSLGQYYIAFFGDPTDADAWELQFGGHHLGINATLDGDEEAITFAPTHLGVQPAVYASAEGAEVQPFSGIYETAFAFYDSLTDEQKADLYQGSEIASMVCAPGDTCSYPTGTGLAGSELTDEQKQLLLDVIANWAGLADEQTTADALAAIAETLDETYIDWSGATVYDMTQGNGIYFQISGPDVYIEFASQKGSAGADVDGVITAGWGHVHTIYRDPSNDYADSVEQQEASGLGGPGGGPAGG